MYQVSISIFQFSFQRKNKGGGDGQQQKGQVEGAEFGVEGGHVGGGGDGGGVESLQVNGDTHQGSPKDVLPKKKYKDIWYTSCPARITVKVIVK